LALNTSKSSKGDSAGLATTSAGKGKKSESPATESEWKAIDYSLADSAGNGSVFMTLKDGLIVRIRIQFGTDFRSFKDISGESWELQDARNPNAQFDFVGFDTNGPRTGTLRFVAWGDFRPSSITFGLKGSTQRLSLADVPPKSARE